MMMDDFLGQINGNDQQQQQQPNPFGMEPFGGAEAAAADPFGAFGFGNGGDNGGGPFLMDDDDHVFGGAVDAEFQMMDNSQHSIGDLFLSGHVSRCLQEKTSMMLSEEELRWARELKGALEASDMADVLTDMQIAQYAIVADGHILNALQRIHAMVAFQKEYDIDDSVAQGMECIEALLDQQDGVFLDVDTNPQTQESVIVVDVRAFNPKAALSVNRTGKGGAELHWKILARGYYYLYKAAQPSLASVRHGLFLVADCDGMGWENFDLESLQRIHAELFQAYPMRWKSIMAYNTGLVANVCWGLCKRLWSLEFRQALELGCQLVDTDASKPPRRMAEMYQQPNVAAVRKKVLRRVGELLGERDENEDEYDFPLVSQ
ncbi:expressed unknown protein [Seminavis robusta]|uniref:CRAL-TRIO domain-containing protein n=1 Tax=Seminavis robusta TaxID=568900 RepID=A0A9N8H9L0_9STRA|nr:expressed unknown protein [Seminavis robusta]|eukprot:Sro195_g083250.1 n/a (376) ;mRNA; f:70780-71907